MDATVPRGDPAEEAARRIGEPRGEFELLQELRQIASQNKVLRSFIGMGYYDTITPPVIQRNILENPGWYTQYTPYQAEIAQGRLEALLNFQTMVSDLTGLPLANASLLDEGDGRGRGDEHVPRDRGRTSGATTARSSSPTTAIRRRSRSCGRGRSRWGSRWSSGRSARLDVRRSGRSICGVLLQYPATDGRIVDYSDVIARRARRGALVVVAADMLALTLIKPPGELGADIAVGSTQRFGVPMGFGGPHAAFMATKNGVRPEDAGAASSACRRMRTATRPIGWRSRRASSTSAGRRRRATSARRRCCWRSWRACTRSITGRRGLQADRRARAPADAAAGGTGSRDSGYESDGGPFFDTLTVVTARGRRADEAIAQLAAQRGFNFRRFDDDHVGDLAR